MNGAREKARRVRQRQRDAAKRRILYTFTATGIHECREAFNSIARAAEGAARAISRLQLAQAIHESRTP